MDANWIKINKEQERAEVEAETSEKELAMRKVIEAARGIRHWHDAPTIKGMVVSDEHVRKLWVELDTYDELCKTEVQNITLPPPLFPDPRLRDTEEHGYIDSAGFIVIIGITYLLLIFAIVGVIK